MKNKNLSKAIMQSFSIILIFLIINASIAFAETNEQDNATAANSSATGTDATAQDTNAQSTSTPTQFACKNPSTSPETILQPIEVERLKHALQNLGKQGGKVFTGAEIVSPDADKNKILPKDRDKLENSSVVIPTGIGSDALLSNMPAQKFSPSEAPFLFNKSTSGPFALGISLDDTLRVGRCENIAEQIDNNSCPMTDRRLEYRTDGAGIIENYKNVWTDLKDWIGVGPDMSEQYTDKQTEQIQTAMAGETDPENLEYKEMKRITGNPIPNSIKTQYFSADIGSTCESPACIMSAYSAFDKYYNSWYAADLVVSNFGPTLLGQAKRYLGYLGRRGWPWTITENKFYQEFRKKFMNPDSLLGKARAKNLNIRVDKYGLSQYRKAFWEGTGQWDSGYSAVKGGSTRKMLDDWLAAGGKLDTEITDPVRRGEFFKMVKEWRSIAKTHGALADEAFDNYSKIISKYGINSAEGKAALIEFAQKNTKLMRDLDSLTHLDFPEYWVKQEVAGLYNKGVKDAMTGEIVPLNGDSHPITAIMQKFEQDGSWANWAESPGALSERFYETTPEGFLKLYQPKPTGKVVDSVTFEDLQKNFSLFQDKTVQLESGEFMKLDAASIDYIAKNASPTGSVKVYEMGWVPVQDVTPEDFAARMTRSRVRNRLSKQIQSHTDRLYNGLIEKGWAGQNRRYLSLLDKAMAQEEEILKSYFSIKGGAKWTVLPFLYWGAKQGGFGLLPQLSAYQLPATWTGAVLSLGDTTLYNDAFIDFFANAGSDDGDIFAQLLNVLPWKMILNKTSDELLPLDGYNIATGMGPVADYRSESENLALFSQTGDACQTCNWTFSPRGINYETGIGDASMAFNTREGTKNIVLEDVISDDAKEQGTTIIAFAHHTDIDWLGPQKAEQDTKIDLAQAQKDKTTCKDALDKIPIVGWFGKISGGKPSRVGAALAFGESLLYFTFGWSGIIGSVIQQTMIAPEFQDCVDDLEGYYIHLFSPAKEESSEKQSPNEIASEKSTEIFKNITNAVLGSGSEDDKSKTFTDVATDKVRNEVQSLSDKQASKTILQALFNTKNLTSGELFGKQLFFLWFKGEQNASKYDTVSKTLIKDPESDISVLIDNEKGQILVNDAPVITSPDHVRLTAPNGNIPAEEIPQRLTKIVLPGNSEEVIFEMDIKSDMRTANTALGNLILNCIQAGVKEQTGVPLTTNNLSDAFGKVQSIVSDTHPNIAADELSRIITAEGAPREIVYGQASKATIKANRLVELLGEKGYAAVGRMDSIQFENGVIVFKPETNELIIWLKRHDKAILNQNDVEGLIATPTVYDPDDPNICPDPAINLEAIPKSGSDLIAKKVENFNDSMETMGPFKIFETDTHRFMFYSKKVDGVCKDFFKMIDKKTGEVYDQEIVGPIENTPTGVKFKTADGQEHTLDFATENGSPTVSYNGQPPEVLRTATGPNGSFWYDPATGNWYPENAQFIPLNEAFKQQGFSTSVGADGKVSQTPGGNPLTVNVGTGSGTPFNLPSLPESAVQLLLFISLLVAVIVVFRIRIEKQFAKTT